MTIFPPLLIPPSQIADPGTVRLGDGMITAKYPTRRALLASAAMIPVALAVDGCTGAIATAIALAPQIASYAATIAGFVNVILPTIKTLSGLSGGAYNTIAWVASKIAATATTIATATQKDGAALVADLSAGFGDIAGKLAGLPSLPGFISAGVADGLALIREAEILVGITPTVPAPITARFAMRGVFPSPVAAQADLQAIIAAHRQ